MRPLLCGVLLVAGLATDSGYAQAPPLPTGASSLTGRILDSASQPVQGAIVLTWRANDGPLVIRAWWSTTSEADGSYRFENLPAGRYAVVTAREGFAGWSSIPGALPAPLVASRVAPALAFSDRVPRLAVELTPGGRASEINLTLRRPASIEGRALAPDGSPVADAAVRLYTTDETGALTGSYGSLPTACCGRFAFDDLPPGRYYLGPSRTSRLDQIDLSTLTAVTIEEGGSLRNIDLPVSGRAFIIAGRVLDVAGLVPPIARIEYGVPGATHRGFLSVLSADGTFQIRDAEIQPGPLSLIVTGETDAGPVVGLLTVTLIDGPNDIVVTVDRPGSLRGRVSLEGGRQLTEIGTRMTLVRQGFAPFGLEDDEIKVSPDGWVEASNLIGEYRVRVDEPQMWTVKAVRRRGARLLNDRIVIRNAELLDDLEIVIGPR